MSVITEAALRTQLTSSDLETMGEYRVEAGTIVTPSARAYLSDHKIDLIIGEKHVMRSPATALDRAVEEKPAVKANTAQAAGPDTERQSNLPAFEKPDRYHSIYGGTYAEKPEYMTALRGTTLVFKDHKIIVLRGKIDSLQARILEVQLALQKLGLAKGVEDLNGVMKYVMEIMRCEVLNEPMPSMQLLGMEEEEIHERSHKPKKYYGVPHFGASLEDGEAVILLNTLRTATREVEIIAYETFKNEYGQPEREDIIQAFNRLSSVFYVMMFRALTKEYER